MVYANNPIKYPYPSNPKNLENGADFNGHEPRGKHRPG